VQEIKKVVADSLLGMGFNRFAGDGTGGVSVPAEMKQN
jgi:hypothetical protein